MKVPRTPRAVHLEFEAVREHLVTERASNLFQCQGGVPLLGSVFFSDVPILINLLQLRALCERGAAERELKRG